MLKQYGFEVIRSPQSRSPFDLIALGPGTILLVQCKIGGRLSPGPWNELFDLAKKIKGLALLAERDGNKLIWHELIGWKHTQSRNNYQPSVEMVWRQGESGAWEMQQVSYPITAYTSETMIRENTALAAPAAPKAAKSQRTNV